MHTTFCGGCTALTSICMHALAVWPSDSNCQTNPYPGLLAFRIGGKRLEIVMIWLSTIECWKPRLGSSWALSTEFEGDGERWDPYHFGKRIEFFDFNKTSSVLLSDVNTLSMGTDGHWTLLFSIGGDEQKVFEMEGRKRLATRLERWF